MPRVSVDFTDGDTFKRVTVTDADVTASSRILPTVEKRDTAEVDDVGWIYVANVISVSSGSFDCNVAALVIDGVPAPNNDFPNEIVQLNYTIQ